MWKRKQNLNTKSRRGRSRGHKNRKRPNRGGGRDLDPPNWGCTGAREPGQDLFFFGWLHLGVEPGGLDLHFWAGVGPLQNLTKDVMPQPTAMDAVHNTSSLLWTALCTRKHGPSAIVPTWNETTHVHGAVMLNCPRDLDHCRVRAEKGSMHSGQFSKGHTQLTRSVRPAIRRNTSDSETTDTTPVMSIMTQFTVLIWPSP